MQPSLAFAIVYSLPKSRHPLARYRALVLLPVDCADLTGAAMAAIHAHYSSPFGGASAVDDIAIVKCAPLNPPHVSTLG